MNTPKLRFKEYNEPFQSYKINEVTDYVDYRGKTPNKTEQGVFLVTAKNIKFGYIDYSCSSEYISEEDYNSVMRRGAPKVGDVLITTEAPLGNIATVDNENIALAQRVIKYRGKKDLLDNYYLKYYFITNKFQKTLVEKSSGGTVKGIKGAVLHQLKINIPSLPEQQKIASFFTAIDQKLTALKKKKELLEQYKKGVMQQIFSQKVRFKDDAGNSFPEWEEKKLGEIGSFQTSSIDKLIRENEKEVYLVNYMNVYRHEDVNNETIKNYQVVTAKDSQIESCNLKRGDILFTPSSETPSDIGHSVVIFEDLENAVFSYHLMRFRPNLELNILYSHYFCNIPDVLSQLSKLSTGSTRFTISVKSFSSVEVKLPCLDEQQKIADFLSAIDNKIDTVAKQIDKTEQWKKGLLQKMFV